MRYLIAGAEESMALALLKRILRDGNSAVALVAETTVELTALEDDGAGVLEVVQVDLGDPEQVAAFMIAQDKMFDGIVYAHMFFEMEAARGFDAGHWGRTITHNLVTPVALFTANPDALGDGSSLVVVTSTEAFQGSYRAAAYAASKAGAHNMVMTLANVLGRRDIRVNAVAPGWIGGVMDTDTVFEMSRSITPLGRLGAPEEVANVAYFLLSPESSFVSGVTIPVDGGYTGVDTISKFEADSADE